MSDTSPKNKEAEPSRSKPKSRLLISRSVFALLVALIFGPLWSSIPFLAGLESSIFYWLFGGTGLVIAVLMGLIAWFNIERCASLKVTVPLLILATFMVWVATLQQTRMDIWDVKRMHFGEFTEHGFLPNLFIYMPLDHFVPPAWQGENWKPIPFGLWLPSGLTTMILLMLNLTAAHLVRFRITGNPVNLLVGLGTIAFGAVVSAAIVWISQNASEIQGSLPADPGIMWKFAHSGLGLIAALMLGYGFLSSKINHREKIVMIGGGIFVAGMLAFMVLKGEALFGDSGMRILWQLFQATVASVLLLIGCSFVFTRRGGIVLLHFGVGLMMVHEVFVSLTNIEQRLTLFEGENGSIAVDVRSIEFVVYGAEDEDVEEGTVVPSRFFSAGQYVEHESLPVDFQFDVYHKNAFIRAPQKREEVSKIRATSGAGTGLYLIPQDATTGTDVDQTVDFPGGYVRIFDKETGNEIGYFLVGEQLFMSGVVDEFEVDGKKYHLALRLRRIEKPYSIQLLDVRKEDYVGTNTPKHYGSEFILTDLKRGGTELRQEISMNNPLRFGNETFYQSGFNVVNGRELTVIQIVKNEGWMIPYLACMYVVIGMSAQLLVIFRRHLAGDSRIESSAGPVIDAQLAPNSAEGTRGPPGGSRPDAIVSVKENPRETVEAVKRRMRDKAAAPLPPLRLRSWNESRTDRFDIKYSRWIVSSGFILVLLIAVAMVVIPARKTTNEDGFNMKRFGEIPVTQNGRVMPIDSVARQTLRRLNAREAPRKVKRSSPSVSATEWLADTLFEKEGWKDHRIYRIDDPNVRHALSLSRRKGYCYTEAELEAAEGDLNTALRAAAEERKASNTETVYEKRLNDVFRLRGNVRILMASSMQISIDEKPTGANIERYLGRLVPSFHEMLRSHDKQNRRSDLPNLVPLVDPQSEDAVEGQANSWAMLTLVQLRRWIDHHGQQDGTKNEFELATEFADNYYFPQLRGELIREAIIRDLMQIDEVRESRKNMTEQELRADLQSYLEKMEPQRFEAFASMVSGPIDLALVQRRQQKISEYASAIEQLYAMTDNESLEDAFEYSERFVAMGKAYREGDAETFNRLVEEHMTAVGQTDPVGYDEGRNRVEAFLNAVSPFYVAQVVYILALVIAIISWIFLSPPMKRLSFWVIGIAVAMQTLGLLLRIYISGRAPVTNLYSSALFVGWAGVLSCLGLELRYRLGTGNVIAAAGGLITLLIAASISRAGGDTIGVQQAVLDTNFWLATHVVIISLGYSGTLLAGFIGVVYAVTHTCMDSRIRKIMESQIHLVTCFSLLLSFFGTVLGGLWADDSWGRFWGWDPKENGALMIVLWNAVVLHARWGGVVKGRGLAVLSIIGTIVVTWSWFAVNELGVGLHQYGASEGTMKKLGLFWTLQIGFCFFVLVPTNRIGDWFIGLFRSQPEEPEEPEIPVAEKVNRPKRKKR